MRNKVITFLIALSLSSISALAGPGVGGGGVLIGQLQQGQVLLNVQDISDVQLKDFSIIATDALLSAPELKESFQLRPSGRIMIDLSKKSEISDVQLIDGDIIKFEIPQN